MDEKQQMMALLAAEYEEKLKSAQESLKHFYQNPPPDEFYAMSEKALQQQILDLQKNVDIYRHAVPKIFSAQDAIAPTAILRIAQLNYYPEDVLPHPHREPYRIFRTFVPFEVFYHQGRHPDGGDPMHQDWPMGVIVPGSCVGLKQGDVFKEYHPGSVGSSPGYWFYRILEVQ